MSKPQFIALDGMEKTTLPEGTDSVRLVLPNGSHLELSWRLSDQIASISCDGQLVIHAWSSNVVRLEVKP